MKIQERKSIFENKDTIVQFLFYGLLAFFIIGSAILLWNIFKPTQELIVDKVIEPQNNPEYGKENLIFLVTDASDYINEDLSVERYRNVLTDTDQYKGSLKWNIFLSGSEFENLKESNQKDRILADMKNQADSGMLEIGYSARYESKYQSDLTYYMDSLPFFKDKVQKAYSFLTCGKEKDSGLCRDFANNQGGVGAIESLFKDTKVVSGIHINSPFSYDYTTEASKQVSDNIGFEINFRAEDIKDYASFQELLSILSPINTTPATAFWMNNKIVVTDFDAKNSIEKINTLNESQDMDMLLENVAQKNEASITPIMFGGHEMYAKIDPIQYAYENGGYEELSIENKFRQIEKENASNLNALNLDAIVKKVNSKDNFTFVTASDIQENILSKDLLNITKQELDHIARWIVVKWNEDQRIPDWTFDGNNFYSLRESFALLYKALSKREKVNEYSLPYANIELQDVYGPYGFNSSKVSNTKISRDIVMGLIIDFVRLRDGGYWDTGYTTNTIEGTYLREREELSAAEMLYAMAVIYTTDYAGKSVDEIAIPRSENYPKTLELLEKGLGCNSRDDCIATSWSLKPVQL